MVLDQILLKLTLNTREAKRAIRQAMLTKRDQVSLGSAKEHCDFLCEKVYRDIKHHGVNIIHCYIPIGSEINLRPLIKRLLDEGHQIICPKTLEKGILQHLVLESLEELEEGRYKTLHPSSNHEYEGKYDYIIVPGLAFDQKGGRLGYGGGYYDRFLEDQKSVRKIALAYPFQIIDKVPSESFDLTLDEVYFKAL